MRRRRFVAVVAMSALLLSGCAVASDPQWTPPGWEEHDIRITTQPEPVDPAGVGALSGERLRNDTVGLQARFSLLPGSGAFDDRIVGMVRDAALGRAAAIGKTYAPEVFPLGAGLGDRGCVRGATLRTGAEVLADPALGPVGGTGVAVVCDIVAATGPILGERVRIIAGGPGGVASDDTTIVYADVATGAVGSAADLWNPHASARLHGEIVELLRREAGALSLATAAPADEAGLAGFVPALETTVPGAGGSLVITIAPGFTAPELAALDMPPTDSPLVIEVPAATAATLVTPLGAALVAAGQAGAAFDSPVAPPAGSTPIDCDLFPCVALTYDDGPSDFTAGILDELASRRAAATFFTMGDKSSRYGDVLRRMVAEGHLAENHTWNHPHLPDIPLDAALRQIRDATGAIEKQTGERVTMFRPPYGEYTSRIVAGAGLPAILWDVDTFDWQGIADDVLIGRAVEQPRPGSIVLQHDIQPNTARTAGAVYDGLRDRGFSLVTVAQLFGGQVPASGAWRSGR